MTYEVQKGDTIARVTSLLGTDWNTLKRNNPDAVGRSSVNGNWFLREGAVLQRSSSFESHLKESIAGQEPGIDRKVAFESEKGSRSEPKAEYRDMSEIPPPPRAEDAGWRTYTIKPGDTIWGLSVRKFRVDPAKVLEINNIENPRTIQPGLEIHIPPQRVFPEDSEVVASWYGNPYHGRPMANGEIYNMYSDTIAHKKLPFGTHVEITNPDTGQKVTAVVRDRGPFISGRDVDLSYGLAKKLSIVEKGVGIVHMRLIG